MNIFVARGDTFPQGIRDQGAGYGDDNHIHRFGQGGKIWIGLYAVDFINIRIDGIKPSRITEIPHATIHAGKSAYIRPGGADHGDGSGMGHDVQGGTNFRRPLLCFRFVQISVNRSDIALIENNQSVHGHHVTFRGNNQRIDVHFLYFRVLQSQTGQAHKHLHQLIPVCR